MRGSGRSLSSRPALSRGAAVLVGGRTYRKEQRCGGTAARGGAATVPTGVENRGDLAVRVGGLGGVGLGDPFPALMVPFCESVCLPAPLLACCTAVVNAPRSGRLVGVAVLALPFWAVSELEHGRQQRCDAAGLAQCGAEPPAGPPNRFFLELLPVVRLVAGPPLQLQGFSVVARWSRAGSGPSAPRVGPSEEFCELHCQFLHLHQFIATDVIRQSFLWC